MQGSAHIDRDALSRAAAASQPIVVSVSVGNGAEARPALVAYAACRMSALWHLPQRVRALAEANPSAIVVLCSFTPPGGPLERAARAFGLTNLQERVALAAIFGGTLKEAARRLGISHVTARETMSAAMDRVGARNLPEMVAKLSRLAFGVLPVDLPQRDLLLDVWGLTPRQVLIGGLVAAGRTREETARALGLSEAVVKKEMNQLFTLLEIDSASQLALVLSSFAAFASLLRVTAGAIGHIDSRAEPLRMVPRTDGSKIAWSDYGPAGGKPVLIVHSSMTTRVAPRGLVRALQERGYRPFAVDRPGYGMSDPVAGTVPGKYDPFAVAAADFAYFADKLRISKFDVVARGGAAFVVALHRHRPDILGRVVLVNPDPDFAQSTRDTGPLGAGKAFFYRQPGLIVATTRIMSHYLTLDRIRPMMERAVRSSPPDYKALQIPGLIEDYHRSLRMHATGRLHGYAAEQMAMALGTKPVPLPGLTHWQMLFGAFDFIHDPEDAIAFWRTVLPDTPIRVVEDAGRFLAMTHAALVADSLAEEDLTKGDVRP